MSERPAGPAVHATAVAIAGRGLLIRGASGSGKSALALALIAAATPTQRIELVGDDRVLLRRAPGGQIVARPHPRIGGFIERRGLGLVAVGWRERAVLAGCVAIDAVAPAGETEAWLRTLPALAIEPAIGLADGGAAERVLAWWDALGGAADRTQVA